MAVVLGKRAGVVGLIGLIVTMILGFGLTKLEFATGQDSYLNSDEQIAKDNVAYQSLFGGQIMLTLITLEDDLSHAELVTGENRETFDELTEELCGEIVRHPHHRLGAGRQPAPARFRRSLRPGPAPDPVDRRNSPRRGARCRG